MTYFSSDNSISNVTANYTGTYPNHTVGSEIAFYLKDHGLLMHDPDVVYNFRDFKYGDYTNEISAPMLLRRQHQFSITAPSDFNSAGCYEEPQCISQGPELTHGVSWQYLQYPTPFTTTIHNLNGSYNRLNPHGGFVSYPSTYAGYSHEASASHDFIRGTNSVIFANSHTTAAQANLSNGIAVTANNNPVARKLMFSLAYDDYPASSRQYGSGQDAPYSGLITTSYSGTDYVKYPFIRIHIQGKDYSGVNRTEMLFGPRIKGSAYTQIMRSEQNGNNSYQQPIVYSYNYYTEITNITFYPVNFNAGQTSNIGSDWGYASSPSVPYKWTWNSSLRIGWAGAFMAVRKDSTSIPALASNDTVIPYIENHTTRTYNPTVDHKMDFRKTGRYFDLKVQVPSTANPKLTGMEFDVKPRGKR
jgi:hypothetical protein